MWVSLSVIMTFSDSSGLGTVPQAMRYVEGSEDLSCMSHPFQLLTCSSQVT